jgi:hypothetical protein
VLFRLPRRRRDLLTASIVREDGVWTVSWIDGSFESGAVFDTLDELIDATDTLVRNTYRRRRGAGPTLQYAIHPWGRVDVFRIILVNNGNSPAALDPPLRAVFHIAGGPGNLTATDISGVSGLVLRGSTPSQLVSQASNLLGNQSTVSFRWIRRIRRNDAVTRIGQVLGS